MANIALFKTGQTPQYVQSAHTPDFASDPDAVINPDISAVSSVPTKYWKRSGDNVVEMTAQEKASVDSAEQTARLASADNLQIDTITLAKALVKLGVATKAQLINAIKQVM
jgi:hypothetical protein